MDSLTRILNARPGTRRLVAIGLLAGSIAGVWVEHDIHAAGGVYRLRDSAVVRFAWNGDDRAAGFAPDMDYHRLLGAFADQDGVGELGSGFGLVIGCS